MTFCTEFSSKSPLIDQFLKKMEASLIWSLHCILQTLLNLLLGLSPAFKTPSPGNIRPWSRDSDDKKYPTLNPHKIFESKIPRRPSNPGSNSPALAKRGDYETRDPISNEIYIILAYFAVALFIMGPIVVLILITFNRKCDKNQEESRALNQRCNRSTDGDLHREF